MTVEERSEDWTPVASTNLQAAGTVDDYLVVQFRNGVYYRYPELAYLFNDLIMAESIGKFFAQNIRNESCEKLQGDEWPDDE